MSALENTDSSVAGSDPRATHADYHVPRSTSCQDGDSMEVYGDQPRLVSWRSGPMELQAALYGNLAEPGNYLAPEERMLWFEDPEEKVEFHQFDQEVGGTPLEVELGQFAVSTQCFARRASVLITSAVQFASTFDEYSGKGVLWVPAHARDINQGCRGASLETFWMNFDEVRATGDARIMQRVAD